MTEEEFDELRRSAFAIAYRMLGSVSEAEDVVQEGFLRLHRAREGGERIESPRAYLSTVVSRLSLDHRRSRAASSPSGGAAVERTFEGGYLAAAVAAEHHVVGQQLLQPVEIALLGGREEAGRELFALLARSLKPRAPLQHAWRRARVASWRAFCSLVPTISAIRSYGSSNTSRSRNAARCSGDRLSSRTRKASDSESAISALRAGSSSALATSGSGSHSPT